MYIKSTTDFTATMIAVTIIIINYLILYLLKHKLKMRSLVPRYVSIIRIILGFTSSIYLIL